MIKTFWDKLDSKQRRLVAGAAILVGVVLILEIAIFPFMEAKKKLAKAINSNQNKLAEMNDLSAEFAQMEAKTAAIKRSVFSHGVNFTLFAYLEKKATQANVRGRIKYMNSLKGTQSSSFEESLVDMRLDKITIKQLTDFLYYAESPEDLVRIKKISINKMKDNPDYLSAQLQISCLIPLNQGQRNR